jgi:integrase
MTRRKKARYGSGAIIERGDTYAIKWRENGKQKWRGGFKSRELAQQALSIEMGRVDRRKAGVPAIDPKTVPKLGDLAEKWIEQRLNDGLHRSARDDKNRWYAYWKDQLGHLRPFQVDTAWLTRAIKVLLAKNKLAPATVMNAVRLLSTFYSDLIEEGYAEVNPVRMLPKKTRHLFRPARTDEPFVERLEDVTRLIAKLQEIDPQVAVAYAVGALAGLRTGEIIGLDWRDIDLERHIIHVRRQVRHGKVGPLKDGDEREAGIQEALLPILVAWRLRTGGDGQLFGRAIPGGRMGAGDTRFIKSATLMARLRDAMRALVASKVVPKGHFAHKDRDGEPAYLTWYQATRHTFASHYMMAGGDIAKLQAELGHSDIQTTQRYAKLAPDFRTPRDRTLIRLPKLTAEGKVVPLSTEIGSKLVAHSKKEKTETVVKH